MDNNSSQPLVSICCITYNHEPYIAQAIQSFLMQKTNFPIEILISDDASTDKTSNIIRDYESCYPNLIKPLYQTKNQYSQGKKPNPEFNFPRARGKYIALCEGDDYWTDSFKLQKQVNFLEQNQDFAICFHNMQIIDKDNPHLNRISNINQQEITTIENLAHRNYIYTASCMFRNYKHELPHWYYQCPVGDYPLHLINAQRGKIKFIDETMGAFRVHQGGVWRGKTLRQQLETAIELFEIIRDKFSKDINHILNNQLLDSYLQIVEHYIQNKEIEKSKFYLMKIIENDPVYLLELIKSLRTKKRASINEITAPLRWLARKIMPNH